MSGILQAALASYGSGLPFDSFSTTHLGVWELQKVRSLYTGFAVRAALTADAGATTLDIGFNADGTFDMAAYSAFGTGSERIVTWYDQSGNGYDLIRAWSATLCPIIRTSSYNSKPCVYFDNGSLGIAGFTDWDGLAAANFWIIGRLTNSTNGYVMTSGTSSRSIYWNGGTADRIAFWGVQGVYGNDTQFYQHARWAGILHRYQFDGAAATNALRAQLYQNTVLQTFDANTGTIPATFNNQTGIYLNGEAAGTNYSAFEYFGFYYVGYAMSASEVTALNTSANVKYFALTDSQIFCCGDSLTLNSANGGPSAPGAYANVLDGTLSTYTGTTWNLKDLNTTSEAGAQTARVLQMMQAGGNTLDLIDTHYPNHVIVAWAGTNDLAAAATAAQALTGSVDIATPASNNGGTVYYVNMLPRQDLGAGNAAFEASRTTYNAGLVAALAGLATVVDIAAIPQLQDPTDTTYYLVDTVHLNDAGNALVAAAVAAAIEADIP